VIQPKYKGKSFEEILNESQELVNIIGDKFLSFGFAIRKYHDAEPFYLPDGTQMRGLDLLVASNGQSIFIDAKDFGRFKYLHCTGLPLSLVTKYRNIKQLFGMDCYLFFRDNKEIEETYESKFKHDNIYIPYGGEIDSFTEHKYSKQEGYKCKWSGRYYNQLQELWEVNRMYSIDNILMNWNKQKSIQMNLAI